MVDLIFGLALLGGTLIAFIPMIFVVIFRKRRTTKEPERFDKDKHRYYPVVFSKELKIAGFFVLVDLLCFLLPIIPIICVPLVFNIKRWVVVLICESLAALAIFIYYRFMVFDISYIELDNRNLEIVHKTGKRELYSLLTYQDYYMRNVRVKYTTIVTKGLIFVIGDQKKEVNLDFLGDEGFDIFLKDFQTVVKTGKLPVVAKTLENKATGA